MKKLIQQICDDLADAFGGVSQFSVMDMGHAIAGQINNNMMPSKRPSLEEVVTAFAEHLEDNECEDTSALVKKFEEALVTRLRAYDIVI